VALKPFLISVAWAGILVSATWPVYRRMLQLLHGRETASALIMTLLLVLTIFGPAATIAWILTAEARGLLDSLQSMDYSAPPTLPEWLTHAPIVGEPLAQSIAAAWADPAVIKAWLAQYRGQASAVLVAWAGDLGRNAAKTLVCLVSAYFLYRHGESIIAQSRTVIARFAGARVHALIPTVGSTIKAVVYGILMTALAQGTLAAIGFWFTGVGAPVLLGVITTFASLIPFGPPFIWLPAAVWLFVKGSTVQGIILVAWGVLVVGTIDNVLRPFFISQATRLPILLIFFGVLGGVSAFGLIGLFIGPVILVILLVLWRDWSEHAQEGS
jgi:predicted PurR-regulated permease PerM